MIEQKSKLTIHPRSGNPIAQKIAVPRLGLNNIIYQIHVGVDGNLRCALIGSNLLDGICGYGDTISDALRNLADNF
jgi:hypothetical protein